MAVLTNTLKASFKPLLGVMTLMAFIMHIFALTGSHIFYQLDEKHFGTVKITMRTLLKILTADEWLMLYESNADHQQSLVLLAFILIYFSIEYFMLLNICTGIIIDNFYVCSKLNEIESDRNRALKRTRKYTLAAAALTSPMLLRERPHSRERVKVSNSNARNSQRDSKYGYCKIMNEIYGERTAENDDNRLSSNKEINLLSNIFESMHALDLCIHEEFKLKEAFTSHLTK
ncbi:hypothetical protein GJ496_002564 [Pomphorhynchus laevis]|nr:hypothetical protein GJ496_002564 [Pomphorhynchus laevis]